MYYVEIDSRHNQLNVTLAGTFDEIQAKEMEAELSDRIHELKKGFCILCDLSELEKFSSSARASYRNCMKICDAAGARKIIRIQSTPTNNFGLNIMSFFHQKDTPIIFCTCRKDALSHLQNQDQK